MVPAQRIGLLVGLMLLGCDNEGGGQRDAAPDPGTGAGDAAGEPASQVDRGPIPGGEGAAPPSGADGAPGGPVDSAPAAADGPGDRVGATDVPTATTDTGQGIPDRPAEL